MTRELDQLVDLEGLDARALERLRGVHELLLEAGPPPELTPALSDAPHDNVVPLAGRRTRRLLVGLASAAAVAAIAFGGGFLLGHGADSTLHAVKVVDMQGEQNSLASIKIGREDADGNWPIEFSVSGLPRLVNSHAYYILMLEQNGKPRFPCGWFRVENGTTTVRFTVPYKITKSSRWVVTSMAPGAQFPGHVVMTTA